MIRRFGAIPDHAADVDDDLRSRHVGILLGASPSLFGASANVDWSGFLGRVPDQAATSACVGFAFATACFMRASISGHAIPRPSAKAIYDFARLIDMPAVLEDIGSRPRSAIQGMREYGLLAEDRWPMTTPINELPPLDIFIHGRDALLTGHYRIEPGPGCGGLIRRALVAGFIPTFAMPVDEAYLTYDGSSVYQGVAGNVVGRHAQAVIGCTEDTFLVANSWGRRWGLEGMARIAASFFDTVAVADVLVPTVIPAEVR